MCFRKRRAQRKSPISIPVAVLDLDEEETTRKGINLSELKLWITGFFIFFILIVSCLITGKAIKEKEMIAFE